MAKVSKVTGKEKQALAMFYALHSVMHKQTPVLEERLRAQGGTAWRDWRCLVTILDRLDNVLVDSMTDQDCEWLRRLLRHAKVGVEFPGPLSRPDYAIISVADLSTITCMAGSNECAVCMKEGKEVKRCELRKAMLNFLQPSDGESDGSLCEYAGVRWTHDGVTIGNE